MAAPDKIKVSAFFFMDVIDIFSFLSFVKTIRKSVPITPRTRAMTEDGRGILRTKRPIVPNMNIARISFAFAVPFCCSVKLFSHHSIKAFAILPQNHFDFYICIMISFYRPSRFCIFISLFLLF